MNDIFEITGDGIMLKFEFINGDICEIRGSSTTGEFNGFVVKVPITEICRLSDFVMTYVVKLLRVESENK